MFGAFREMLERINRSIDGLIDPHDPQCEAGDVFDDRLEAANAFMSALENAEGMSGRRAFNMLALAGAMSNTDAKALVVDAVSAELGLPALPIEVKRNFGSGMVRIPEQTVPERTVYFLLQDPDSPDFVDVAAAAFQQFRLRTVFTRISYDEALDDGRVAVQVLEAAKKPTVDVSCH